jgi:hypothetical protein
MSRRPSQAAGAQQMRLWRRLALRITCPAFIESTCKPKAMGFLGS